MRKKSFKLKSPLFLLAALIGAGALAANFISFFVRDPKTAVYDLKAEVPRDALFFKPYSDTPHTEGIYLQFDSENGYDFYSHFIFADLGRFLNKSMIDYKLHYPDGTYKVFGTKFDREECSFARDRFEWKIGPNWLKGDSALHRLHIDSGPLKLEINLKPLVPFYRVGDNGMIYVEPKRKQYMQLTYFPLYEANGSIRDGNTVIPISGWGYGNYSTTNFNLYGATSLHTALRWQKDGLGFDFHDYQAPPQFGGNWFGVLMVYEQGKLIQVNQNYTKQILEKVIEPKTGIKVPIGYCLTSKAQGVTVKIEFTGVKLTDYNDPLVWLGSLEKKLIQLVTNPPLDLRFDGRVKLTLTTEQGTIIKQGPGHGLALVSQ